MNSIISGLRTVGHLSRLDFSAASRWERSCSGALIRALLRAERVACAAFRSEAEGIKYESGKLTTQLANEEHVMKTGRTPHTQCLS